MRYVRGVKIIIVLVSFLVLGCGSDRSSYSLLPDSEVFEQSQTFNNKLDILFVIRDGPSMSSHQDALVASIESFISTFVTKGFDFKIAVATTSAYMADPTLAGYDPANEGLADFNDYDGTTHSGVYVLTPDDPNIIENFSINAKPDKNSAGQDGRAFSSFRQALRNERPINQGFLREDSFLAVVIIDNEDDFSGNERCTGCDNDGRYDAPTLDPVNLYRDYLDVLTGTEGATARYNVSAMTQIAEPCQGGANMVRIMELVELTNGVMGDICQTNYGPSLALISDQIATLSSQFFLDRKPIESTIVVKVDGALVSRDSKNGWTYNPEANSIVFHGDAIPAQGAKVFVDYDPETLKL